jgi:hypothetical protein
LLAAHHDEFTAALDQLDGRFEFQVKGRYVKSAVLRVIGDLAQEWEGRIDVQLLGPMVAYHFTGSAQSES